jgi:hypothetical protein
MSLHNARIRGLMAGQHLRQPIHGKLIEKSVKSLISVNCY